jgi:hypothetical protein
VQGTNAPRCTGRIRRNNQRPEDPTAVRRAVASVCCGENRRSVSPAERPKQRAYTEAVEAKQQDIVCRFHGCAEPPTETIDIQAGYAEYRCAAHARDREWLKLPRLRLEDMRPLAPGESA